MQTQAFSLIELMVVIAIVALLSSVALPAYNDYMGKAKVAAAISSLNSVLGKMREYYNTNGVFPLPEDMGFTTGVNENYLQNPTAVVPGANDVIISGGDLSLMSCSDGSNLALGSAVFVIPDNNKLYVGGYYLYAKSNEDTINSFCVEWRSTDGLSDDDDVEFDVYLNCTLPDGNEANLNNVMNFLTSC